LIAGEIITIVLSNSFVVFLLIAILTSIAKIRRARRSRRPFSPAYVVWGELLFYVYGLATIYSGAFHAYAGPMVAASIGWQPSPFQYELGWFEIAYGLTALLSLWRGYQFRFAMTFPYSLFLLAAAAQHVTMMLDQHNYAPNNAGILLWIGDIAVPLVMLLLSWLAARDGT
jgi:Family of unknown function (DUF6790)